MDDILYVTDVAKKLRRTVKTVYNMIHEYGMDKYCIKIGGVIAIRQKDLDRYLDDMLGKMDNRVVTKGGE